MSHDKPVEGSHILIPVILEEQISPTTFAFALQHIVDIELDLTPLDEQFKNDATGASAYDPRVMVKILLLAYSRGLISSRSIARECEQNVEFMAVSGNSRPSYSHIAKFVRRFSNRIQPLFMQVLLICDAQGVIDNGMFIIDGVELPGKASKKKNGTRADFKARAEAFDKAAAMILECHRARDESKSDQLIINTEDKHRIELQLEAQLIREFFASIEPKLGTDRALEVKGARVKGK